jgi:hypothetical protein
MRRLHDYQAAEGGFRYNAPSPSNLPVLVRGVPDFLWEL